MTDSLYSLFMPPEGFGGDFGVFCGFTAAPDTLIQIKRRFSPEEVRPALAAFIHPTVAPISDVPGLAWMWMDPKHPDYKLLHAKVALLGFRRSNADSYLIRLAVSTGNWTQDPLTHSIDMYWSIDLDLSGRIDPQTVADIRAAWDMFEWLRGRANTSQIDRDYDGVRPGALLRAAIDELPPTDLKSRFIDSRVMPLSEQVIERLTKGKRMNRLVIGSGFFEGENAIEESVPERVRRQLIERRRFDPNGTSYLTLNPDACQGLASRPATLQHWQICPPKTPLHAFGSKLHAKFIALANQERDGAGAKGRIYLGSGNLSRIGFETSARAGGNLEAGVVFETGNLPWQKARHDDICKRLPVDFDNRVQVASLLAGKDFERPEEPTSLPPVTFLIWADDTLSAPDAKHVEIMRDGMVQTTPCDWPGNPPAIVVTAADGWRLPVIADGVLVVPRPRDMRIEDILAGLGSFPLPAESEPIDEADSETRGEEEGDGTPVPQSVYPIRRMMQLLVQLGEAQARVDRRDWPRWCRELRQNLVAITQLEHETIAFFRNARSNPLLALLDERMRPKGVDMCLLEDALQTASAKWELADYPSLWAEEAV